MKKYEKIRPLGIRAGLGTYETIFRQSKYASPEQAIEANDAVIIDFVKDEKGLIHFSIYHIQTPHMCVYRMLAIQKFHSGVDCFDDMAACSLAEVVFDNFEKSKTT